MISLPRPDSDPVAYEIISPGHVNDAIGRHHLMTSMEITGPRR